MALTINGNRTGRAAQGEGYSLVEQAFNDMTLTEADWAEINANVERERARMFADLESWKRRVAAEKLAKQAAMYDWTPPIEFNLNFDDVRPIPF